MEDILAVTSERPNVKKIFLDVQSRLAPPCGWLRMPVLRRMKEEGLEFQNLFDFFDFIDFSRRYGRKRAQCRFFTKLPDRRIG